MPTPRHIVFFGTYDKRQHPRIAVLIDGLRSSGVEVTEVSSAVWASTDEKISAARDRGGSVKVLLRTLKAWPALARRYRKAGPHDAVVVGYMGQLDVLLARLLVRRRVPIVLDLFVSLFDTAVSDRKLVATGSWKARLLRAADRWAYRAADLVMFDTESQRDHFIKTFGVDPKKARVVEVGAESAFSVRPPRASGEPMRVLFYGLYTPLQGATVIAEATRRLAGERIEITMIGDGQDRKKAEVIAGDLPHVRFQPAVPYEKLADLIADHDVVLGVFGPGKGLRVVPNKVFQAAAVGRAIVTAECDAVRGTFGDSVVMVPAEDPEALGEALIALRDDPSRVSSLGDRAATTFESRFSTGALGAKFLDVLEPRPKSSWTPPPRYLLRKEVVVPLARRLAPGSKILEVGVGAGDMSATLGRLGYVVEGIDASAPAIAEAQHRIAGLERVRIRQLDLFRIREAFASEFFDGVVAMEVLEHLRDDDVAAGLLYEVMRPGGLIVISVPAGPERFDEDDRAVGHYRRYDRAQIRALLERAGFSIEGVWCYGFPLGNLLKWVRARRMVPAPVDAVPEELSDHSGIRADLPRAIRPFVRRETLMPFLLVQRAFFRTELGEGYVVLARRPR